MNQAVANAFTVELEKIGKKKKKVPWTFGRNMAIALGAGGALGLGMAKFPRAVGIPAILGTAGIIAYGHRVSKKGGGARSTPAGFARLMRTNPRSDELDKAFSLYRKETGKSQNEMTHSDINTYVLRIRSR